MNDDITRRVAETLRAEASTVRSPADAWDRFEMGNITVIASTSSRRRWLFVPAGLVVAVAAAVIGIALGSRSHPAPAPIVSPSPPTVVVTTTTAAPAAIGPVGGPVPKGFTADSVTFVSASDGWVLGSAPCASAPCTSMARTVDGGRTWKGVPAPRDAAVTTVRFGDRMNGWAFGAHLWATHDGGATWHAVTIRGLSSTSTIEDLEAAGGHVHIAFTDDQGAVRIATSLVDDDSWAVAVVSVPIGGGPVPTGQFVLHGSVGWFVQVDRTTIGGASLTGGTWAAWTPPCLSLGGPAVLAASSATELVAACDAGLWTGGAGTEQLWASHDSGASFVKGPDVPLRTVSAVAATSARVLVAGDTTDGEQALYLDTGGSWEPALRRSGTTWRDVGFTTDTQGVAISSRELLLTRDGGLHWSTITFS